MSRQTPLPTRRDPASGSGDDDAIEASKAPETAIRDEADVGTNGDAARRPRRSVDAQELRPEPIVTTPHAGASSPGQRPRYATFTSEHPIVARIDDDVSFGRK